MARTRHRRWPGVIAQASFAAILAQARQQELLSSEHFTVDGTLLEAWASHKSFQPKGALMPPTDDDPGTPPSTSAGSNATHQSTTDPDAQLVRQSRGQAAILAYWGHVLMETPSELVVGVHNEGRNAVMG